VDKLKKRHHLGRTKAMSEYMADHPYCEGCGATANECHHIARRALPDTDSPGNFLALCFSCHHDIYHGESWRAFINTYPHLENKILRARQEHHLRTE